jgi:hypothetical protein
MTTTNTLFPGRPDYTGPTTGLFGLLHHEVLFESSHDVRERVQYVKDNKPPNEVAVRLHNMIYLGDRVARRDTLRADYDAKRDALRADYDAKCDALRADYWAKRDALYADYDAKRDALYADYWAKYDALNADYWAKRDALRADYWAKRDALYADYWAKYDALYADILADIRQHIPDCAWNGQTLVFPACK